MIWRVFFEIFIGKYYTHRFGLSGCTPLKREIILSKCWQASVTPNSGGNKEFISISGGSKLFRFDDFFNSRLVWQLYVPWVSNSYTAEFELEFISPVRITGQYLAWFKSPHHAIRSISAKEIRETSWNFQYFMNFQKISNYLPANNNAVCANLTSILLGLNKRCVVATQNGLAGPFLVINLAMKYRRKANYF